jgi:transcriptional regulator with XRE-family HTH domain
MNAEVFGYRLKEILSTLGMSQADLAYKTGLTAAAVSQIINGKREPSLSSIVAILQVIPVKFERLIEERF